METLRPKPLILPSQTPFLSSKSPFQLGIFTLKCRRNQSPVLQQFTSISATLNTPKGFGPTPKKSKRTKKPNRDYDDDDDDDGDEGEDRGEAGVIPEIVTNRMMNRMAFSVGIPLFTGLLFFPLFYYLKAGLKIDVPTWVPFIVSFIFLGQPSWELVMGLFLRAWIPREKGHFGVGLRLRRIGLSSGNRFGEEVDQRRNNYE